MKRSFLLAFVLIFGFFLISATSSYYVLSAIAKEITIDLLEGWSLFSLPLIPDSATLSDLFKDAEVVYSYEKGLGYTRVKWEAGENLELGKGYWILLNKTQSYTLSGEPICEHQYTVYEDGWYLIGGISYPSYISIEKGKIIVIYRYAQEVGYQRIQKPEKIEPGKGYWILLKAIEDETNLNCYCFNREMSLPRRDRVDLGYYRAWRASDIDGNGLDDFVIYRPVLPEPGSSYPYSKGHWIWKVNESSATGDVPWGTPECGDIPVPADYDGDGKTELTVYRPGNNYASTWHSRDPSRTVKWGWFPDDIPVPADYDGDHKADWAIYRVRDESGVIGPTGRWFVLSNDESHYIYSLEHLGEPRRGDIPVPADYDGDGCAELAVYRPTSGTWLVCNEVIQSGNRRVCGSVSETQWGTFPYDVPVPSDYDGDGWVDFAIYRPRDKSGDKDTYGRWYVKSSRTGQVLINDVAWGTPYLGDIPVPGNYDSPENQAAELAVYRPPTGEWLVRGGPTITMDTVGDRPVSVNAISWLATQRLSTRWQVTNDPNKHHAFTDLAFFSGDFYLTYRDANIHHWEPGNEIVLKRSLDLHHWNEVARFGAPGGTTFDIRDPKLMVHTDASGTKKLILTAYTSSKPLKVSQTYAFDPLGSLSPHPIGLGGEWLWRPAQSSMDGGVTLVVSYRRISTDTYTFGLRLYQSNDGLQYTELPANLEFNSAPISGSEVVIDFLADGRAIAVVRREDPTSLSPINGLIGLSSAPYTSWTWRELDTYVGGQDIAMLTDGRVLLASRLHDGSEVRNSLLWLDVDTATTHEFMVLSSGDVNTYSTAGDTAYAGLSVDGQLVSISYYHTEASGNTSVFAAQLDLDPAGLYGDDDLVFYRQFDGRMMVYRTGLDGSLHRPPTDYNIAANYWDNIFTGDFDGDGQDEIVFHDQGDARLRVYQTLPTGSLMREIEHYTFDAYWQNVFTGDFDGDGRDELVFHNSGDARVKIHKTGPDGSLTKEIQDYTFSSYWDKVFTGDFDGDHQDELVFHHSGSEPRLRVYRTNPDGSFKYHIADYPFSSYWDNVSTGDFDGDGKDELMFHHQASEGWIEVYRTDSLGTLQEKIANYQVDSSWEHVFAGNFDGY